MSKTKKEFKFFTVAEYEKEQEYLREMHKHGWKLHHVAEIGMYHFEECEPADVIYQLDYNPEGLKHKEEYVQMFEDCGWEYMQDYVGYSYFRKPVGIMNEDESIFCDDESRLQFLKRVFRGRMVVLLLLFFLGLLPGARHMLVANSPDEAVFAIIYLALIVLYLCIFLNFAKHYISFKKRMQRG